jgi:SIR2-like domain
MNDNRQSASLAARARSQEELVGHHEVHYAAVVRELTEGSVVPLLGAGVNLCDRPPDVTWARGGNYLPSGQELAQHLAATFFYPRDEPRAAAVATEPKGSTPPLHRPLDLLRVSQYIASTDGAVPLYRELRTLFSSDYPPGRVHEFFAAFPGRMRARGTERYQLIVTTNYDDALERAFVRVGEPYDVVWYIADPEEQRGKFWHRPHGGVPQKITRPNKYDALSLDQGTVILKIHGAIDREEAERDSFVITEDHYIDYLTKTDIEQLLPPAILVRLRKSCFLFLGYSMADWNLRVILHRIWGEQPLSYRSWAIRKDADAVEQALWESRKVDVLDIPLEDYMTELELRLGSRTDPVS